MKAHLELLLWVGVITFHHSIGGARNPPPGGGNHVVCYYRGWSNGVGQYKSFQPEDIDPYLCTHIIYGYAFFGSDYNFDKEQGSFMKTQPRLIALKNINPDLKIILGTGRWRNGSTNFVNITATQQNRMRFARNALKFLRGNNFDGFELNWEHPTFREGGTPQDKNNYVYLAETLRNEFEKESTETGNAKLLLVLAITSSIELLPAYDLTSFNIYVDLINVLSYDYNRLSYQAKHHAPLYTLPGHSDNNMNVDYTINYFLESVDPNKLVLGIPAYGRIRTLINTGDTEIAAHTWETVPRAEDGFTTYFEICSNIKNDGWTKVDVIPAGYVGPYAYKGDQWVSFDDEDMVRSKARYAREKGLAGVMIWTLGFDDYLGTCENRKFPLINAAKNELNGIQRPGKTPNWFSKDQAHTMIRPETTVTTTTISPATSTIATLPETTGEMRPTSTQGMSKGPRTEMRYSPPKGQKKKTPKPLQSDGDDDLMVVELPFLSPFMQLIVSNSSISISIKEVNIYNKKR